MPNWIRPETRLRLYARAMKGGEVCCEVCDAPVVLAPMAWRDGEALRAVTIDHLDPSGGNAPDNLQVACLRCNRDKATFAVPRRGDQLLSLAAARRVLAALAAALSPRLRRALDGAA